MIDMSGIERTVALEMGRIAQEHCRPSVLYRPTLRRGFANTLDWVAEYGLCKGVGPTPAAAMANFDERWGDR